MAISAKPMTDTDLATVFDWWRARGCGEMPDGLLPPFGVMSSNERGPGGAGFAYFCEVAPVAFLDWFVTAPGLTAGDARRHLRAVLEALQSEADRRGVKFCLGCTSEPAMAREAERVGFFPVEGQFKHFIHCRL
jgi:hypothetical protein